jgi:hypothetical protein
MRGTSAIIRLFLALLLSAAGIAVSAQSAEQFTTWGDRAMTLGDHYGASRYYGEALLVEPGILETQWKYAEACRLSNQYGEAETFYNKVERKDRGIRHPGALRWLAEMQMAQGHYGDAEKTWPKVKRKERHKDPMIAQRADNGLEGCRMAKAMLAAPNDSITMEHLPMPVNSYDSEFGARIGPDSALYFTSLRGDVDSEDQVQDTTNYRARIFRTRETAGEWSGPRPLEVPNTAMRNQANSTWSLDGRWFYFSQDEGNGIFSIWAIGREHPGSSPVKVIGDGAATCTQPMVALVHGVQTLFFAKADTGENSGMDIWSCTVDGTNTSDAKALGAPIDTPGNETCPYFDSASSTLWFSSDFLPGLGGYDIFKSALGTSGFAAPVNAGVPLNGPTNDLYPTYDDATKSGWITSNRLGSFTEKSETCCNDLYRFSYPHIALTPRPDSVPVPDTAAVAEARTRRITSLREKLPIRLYFHNDEPDPRSWDTLTTTDYAQSYHAYTALYPEYRQAWQADTDDIGRLNTFFTDEVDGGFAQLNDFIALLKQALDEGQHIELQVRGFASPLAKSDYNKNLSLRRIESLILYLRRTDKGALMPYIDGTATNGGSLRIVKLPYGKSRASTNVSDRLDDLRHSVYSVGAAKERRIEIEQVMGTP